MLIINGKKPARKSNVYVNGKRKTSGGGAPPAPYQEWSGFPHTPETFLNYLDVSVDSKDYPYQVILTQTYNSPTGSVLYVSAGKLYHGHNGSGHQIFSKTERNYRFEYSAGAWVILAHTIYTEADTALRYNASSTNDLAHAGYLECSNDIYTDSSVSVVYQTKTTP